jgi:hypothetical protein
MSTGRDGGIGRRAGLRIQCRKRRAGSSPVPGTNVLRYVAIPSSRVRIQTLNLIFNPGGAMIERNLTLPEMILWTGTRVALGVGIGMLVSRGLSKDAMKVAGLALAVVGGFTTIPLAMSIAEKKNLTRSEIRSVA